ncbi:MAG: DNA-binding protein WhiA [Clostridia bacterium]|nr:DNA-binding protein WhiA [Clostridia bacterium]
MNFTSDIKKEMIARLSSGNPERSEKKAALSAFIRTSGQVGCPNGIPAFYIVSETEHVAEFFTSVFSEIFQTELFVTHAAMNRLSGRDKLILQCPSGKSQEVLKTLGFLKRTGELREEISGAFLARQEDKIAYIQGAFLGSGSCSLPSEKGKTGYHLEIVFPYKKTAKDFCRILEEFELFAKLIERKDDFVVYVKNKEGISDFLSVIGVPHCLKKFDAFLEKRDQSNQSNRAQNCISGNADKTAIASVKQVVAIEKLKKSGILETLGDELKMLAKIRTENPTLSLQELSERMKVSKSCLNHRMRRLIELSEKITAEENEKDRL